MSDKREHENLGEERVREGRVIREQRGKREKQEKKKSERRKRV